MNTPRTCASRSHRLGSSARLHPPALLEPHAVNGYDVCGKPPGRTSLDRYAVRRTGFFDFHGPHEGVSRGGARHGAEIASVSENCRESEVGKALGVCSSELSRFRRQIRMAFVALVRC